MQSHQGSQDPRGERSRPRSVLGGHELRDTEAGLEQMAGAQRPADGLIREVGEEGHSRARLRDMGGFTLCWEGSQRGRIRILLGAEGGSGPRLYPRAQPRCGAGWGGEQGCPGGRVAGAREGSPSSGPRPMEAGGSRGYRKRERRGISCPFRDSSRLLPRLPTLWMNCARPQKDILKS